MYRDVLVAERKNYRHDHDAVKALVALYGPREAARVSGIPYGTIAAWCFRFKWKKANLGRPVITQSVLGKDAGDMLKDALESSRDNSVLNLAKYTEKASQKAADSENPLEIARKVRDVAGVFSTIFPQEQGSELIEGAILIGSAKVVDNPQEILEAAKEAEVIDVREELSDQGSAGD